MKRLLCYCLAGLLASCATTKPLPVRSAAEQEGQRESYWQPQTATSDSTSGPRSEPGSQADLIRSIFEGRPPVVMQVIPSDVEAAPDSLPFVKVERKPSLVARLFGRKPRTAIYVGLSSIKAGKKSTITINMVAGNQTNSTATTGKKATGAAGPGAVASVIEKKAGPAIVASDSTTQNAILGGGNIQATTGNNNAPQLTAPVHQAADWKATLAKPVGVALVILFLFILYKRRKNLSNNA